MFYADYEVSGRAKKSTKAFVESVIAEYNERDAKPSQRHTRPFQEESDMVMKNMMQRDAIHSRYNSFAETVRNSLVTEALVHLFNEAVTYDVYADPSSRSIMRAMVSQYVHENNYAEIMNRMKTASVYMSEMHGIIDRTAKAILEEVDKSQPETFMITPEMKDEFFKQLDYSDSEAIADAIRARVTDSIQDFVTANTKDHEDITAALQSAQEKISNVPEDETELRESYEMQGKRKVAEIRNAPKGVFHAMVSATCESTLKHQDTHKEFMNEGHLDIDKIVKRTSIMYTFMEMLNTTRLDKIDAAFIEGVIADLGK